MKKPKNKKSFWFHDAAKITIYVVDEIPDDEICYVLVNDNSYVTWRADAPIGEVDYLYLYLVFPFQFKT